MLLRVMHSVFKGVLIQKIALTFTVFSVIKNWAEQTIAKTPVWEGAAWTRSKR